MHIRLSGFGDDGKRTYDSGHDWKLLNITLAQGGSRGVVFSPKGNYRTAFVEVFGDEIGFIRGEGNTLQEAADSAWEKANAAFSCKEHEYEPRGYMNGAGFCIHCNRFESGVFTAEELGQFCSECGVPTYGRIERTRGDQPIIFRCDDHVPGAEYLKEYRRALNEEDTEEGLDDIFDLWQKRIDLMKQFWEEREQQEDKTNQD